MNEGATIAEVNQIWRDSLKQQSKKHKLYDCPYPPLTYNSTSGKMVREKVECKNGQGKWCKLCARHTRWQKQQGASSRVYYNKKLKMLDSYNKTGLVPHLRAKPNPVKVTNPFGSSFGGIL